MQYIYTLTNPETGLIFYVGRTNNPEMRYKQHCFPTEQNTYMTAKYIKIMLNRDVVPVMDILEEVDGIKAASEIEMKYIDEYWNSYTLLNELVPAQKKTIKQLFKNKDTRIKSCGVNGYYCGYYKDCSTCFEIEKSKRIDAVLSIILNYAGPLFRAVIDDNNWDNIRQKISRSHTDYIRIPQDNGTAIVYTSVNLDMRNICFVEVSTEKAVDELTEKNNLFTKKQRSSSRSWHLKI